MHTSSPGGIIVNQELKDILEMAISFEKESFLFYNGLKDTINNTSLHQILADLATSEIKHRTTLEDMMQELEAKEEEMFVELEPKQVENLKLSDFLISTKLNPDSSFQDILIAAMHREGRAYEFYENMLKLAKSEDTKQLFKFLSKEELDHKNIIEKLYDDEVYKEF